MFSKLSFVLDNHKLFLTDYKFFDKKEIKSCPINGTNYVPPDNRQSFWPKHCNDLGYKIDSESVKIKKIEWSESGNYYLTSFKLTFQNGE